MATLFTKGLSEVDRSAVVTKVHLACSPVDISNPDSILHWAVSLELTETSSVIMDMIPAGIDGRTGVLVVSSSQERILEHSVEPFTISTANTATVNDLLSVIIDKKRHQYKYDDSGSGCRYWCTVVVDDWEQQGLVTPGAHNELENHISQLSGKNPARVPMPVRKGTFY
ncbi:hypothetical protein SCP_0401490 [Sparassis crispa]|uniref:DUF7770 domain-containing protein n=1 Tax=Sparassis crispa TaxID=139825 RepID=A0A401GHV6_9APHY|nr:hypothetical protein SCP_0401490 [Sparassis crispa]GBE81776.1 hypothetical protein SCP_0401490 [Sparassis crispa]